MWPDMPNADLPGVKRYHITHNLTCVPISLRAFSYILLANLCMWPDMPNADLPGVKHCHITPIPGILGITHKSTRLACPSVYEHSVTYCWPTSARGQICQMLRRGRH